MVESLNLSSDRLLDGDELNKHVNTLHVFSGVMQRHLKIRGQTYLWILAFEPSCLSVEHENSGDKLKYHSRGFSRELDGLNV